MWPVVNASVARASGQGGKWQEMWEGGPSHQPLCHCDVAFPLNEMESHWRLCTLKCSDVHPIYISFCVKTRLQAERVEAGRVQNSGLDQVSNSGGVDK